MEVNGETCSATNTNGKCHSTSDLAVTVEQKKRRTFGDTCRHWAQTTTAHGVSELAERKPCAWKITWIVIILLCLFVMGLSLSELILTYSQRKWTTTVFEEMWTSERDSTPPIVTICNFNRLDGVKSVRLGFDEQMMSYLFANTSDEYCYKEKKMENSARQRYSAWRQQRNASYKDIYQLVGHDCDETIPMARYANEEQYVRPCDSTNVQGIRINEIYTKTLGKCFQMRVEKSKEHIDIDPSANIYAFYIRMQPERMVHVVRNNYIEEGFILHVSTDEKVDLSRNGRILLPPGFSSSIRLKLHRTQLRSQNNKSFFKLLMTLLLFDDKPPCAEADTELKYFTNLKYTKQSCIEDCVLGHYFYHQCGCVPVHTDRQDTRICEIEEVEDCLGRFETENGLSSEQKRRQTCRETCQEPCNAEYFKATSSLISYPNLALIPIARQKMVHRFPHMSNYTDEQLKRQLTNVKLHMESLSTTVTDIYQDSTFEGLISSIGGTLGLWSGMSFITVFHAFFILITHFALKEHHETATVTTAQPADKVCSF